MSIVNLKAEKREKKRLREKNRRPSLAGQKQVLEQVGYYAKMKKKEGIKTLKH